MYFLRVNSTHQLNGFGTSARNASSQFNIVCIAEHGTTIVRAVEISSDARFVSIPNKTQTELGHSACILMTCPGCGSKEIKISPAEVEYLATVAGFRIITTPETFGLKLGNPIDTDEIIGVVGSISDLENIEPFMD